MNDHRNDVGFGVHVGALREARGLSKERLSRRTGLSSETIRRIESGSFSPTLRTLQRLCSGLNISFTTLFYGYEQGSTRLLDRELVDLFRQQAPEVRELGMVVLRELFAMLDRRPQ